MADTDPTLKLIFSSIKSERDRLLSSLLVVDELIKLCSDDAFKGGTDLKLPFIELLSKLCSAADQLDKNVVPECRRVLEMVRASGDFPASSTAPTKTPGLSSSCELFMSKQSPIQCDVTVPAVSPALVRSPAAPVSSWGAPMPLTTTITTCASVQNVLAAPTAQIMPNTAHYFPNQIAGLNPLSNEYRMTASKVGAPLFLPASTACAFSGVSVPPLGQSHMNPCAPAFLPVQAPVAIGGLSVPFPAPQHISLQQKAPFSGLVPAASLLAAQRLHTDPLAAFPGAALPQPLSGATHAQPLAGVTHSQPLNAFSFTTVASSHHIQPPPATFQNATSIVCGATFSTVTRCVTAAASVVFTTAKSATCCTAGLVTTAVSPVRSRIGFSPAAVEISPAKEMVSVAASCVSHADWSPALSKQMSTAMSISAESDVKLSQLQLDNQLSAVLKPGSATSADQLVRGSDTSLSPARGVSSRATALMAKCSARVAPTGPVGGPGPSPGARVARTLAPQPPLKVGESYDVHWVYCDSESSRHYFTKVCDSEALSTINNHIQQSVSEQFATAVTSATSGDCVIAMYEQEWYRAVVVDLSAETSGTMVTLMFVDYGNVCCCSLSELREIPHQLLQTPALAYQCRIGGFDISTDSSCFQLQSQLLALLTDTSSWCLQLSVVGNSCHVPSGCSASLYDVGLVCVHVLDADMCVDLSELMQAVSELTAEKINELLLQSISINTIRHLLDIRKQQKSALPSIIQHPSSVPIVENVKSRSDEVAHEYSTDLTADESARIQQIAVSKVNSWLSRLACDEEKDRRREKGGAEQSDGGGSTKSGVQNLASLVSRTTLDFENPPMPPSPAAPADLQTQSNKQQRGTYRHLHVVWNVQPVDHLHQLSESAGEQQQMVQCVPRVTLLLYVESPALFYLPRGDPDMFDRFEQRLADVYSCLPLHVRQLSACAYAQLLVAGSYWVGYWPEKEGWFRCVVRRKFQGSVVKKSSMVSVFWVDYGDTGSVHPHNLRPITSEFASVAVFSIRARLAYAYPVSDDGVRCDEFTPAACEQFQRLVAGQLCRVIPLLSDAASECIPVSLHITDSDRLPNSADPSVLQCLSGLQLAGIDLPADNCPVTASSAAGGERDEQLKLSRNVKTAADMEGLRYSAHSDISAPCDWDPMRDDYEDLAVSDGAQSAPHGWSGTSRMRPAPDSRGTRVCRYYARGARCWDGPACKFLHQIPSNTYRACDATRFGGTVQVNKDAMLLPSANTLVYVCVCHVQHPGLFYVQLPFGTASASTVGTYVERYRQTLCGPDSLDTLMVDMRLHYEKDRSVPSSSRPEGVLDRPHYTVASLPLSGEVVAVRWQKQAWVRGKVLTAVDVCTNEPDIKVFLLDFGDEISCALRDIRRLERKFNLLPYQAIRCQCNIQPAPVPLSTAELQPDTGSWSPAAVERFTQLLQPSDEQLEFSLARVIGCSSTDHFMLVDIVRVAVETGLTAAAGDSREVEWSSAVNVMVDEGWAKPADLVWLTDDAADSGCILEPG